MLIRYSFAGGTDREVGNAINKIIEEINGADARFQQLVARVEQNKPLTLAQIRDALQSTGSTPLNITQLLGASSLVGTARVGTHAQRVALNPSSLAVGTVFLETDRHAVYVVDTTKQWQLILAIYRNTGANRPSDLTAKDQDFWFVTQDTGFTDIQRWTGTAWNFAIGYRRGTHAARPAGPAGLDQGVFYLESDRGDQAYRWNGSQWILMKGWGDPMTGTLSPDQKPGLLAGDAGFKFWATDFNRVYEWTGAIWQEAPLAPARYQIGLFQAAPDPGAGWFLADGSTVTQSNPNGTTSSYVTPNLSGSQRVPRMNSTAGGTGGAASHQTATPSTLETVDNNGGGSTVQVAAFDHTHAVTTTDPYYDLIPYIRL